MPRPRRSQSQGSIEAYDHTGQERLNNPPAGLVSPDTDRDAGRRTYEYDPHLAPQLQWAGKAEYTSFEVSTVSLHVHERIDPRTIIEAARKRNNTAASTQGSLFDLPEENPPLRSAIEFYQHRHNWSNRLVAGDSLLVMNSLLEKEGMGGKVQMVYIGPPYGIRYGSNFQPFVNRRDVWDGRDEDLTQEPEMVKAFRDTWELGIHSYLSYLRDRLLLAREMLTESGSCLVQIGDENVHLVRNVMDEVFGVRNFVSQIIFQTSSGRISSGLDGVYDVLLWYARKKESVKYRELLKERSLSQLDTAYSYLHFHDGLYRSMAAEEKKDSAKIPPGTKRFRPSQTQSQSGGESARFRLNFEGQSYSPPPVGGWQTTEIGFSRVARASRLMPRGRNVAYRLCNDDYPFVQMSNIWTDTLFVSFGSEKQYVVQTNPQVIQRCILMTTDPGDLNQSQGGMYIQVAMMISWIAPVNPSHHTWTMTRLCRLTPTICAFHLGFSLVFDPTCGSGTTAYVAEQWGRRWITCDTSRVAITLAKQRLMTAIFDYYQLAHPEEGVGSGFNYKTVPHITLGSIANNPEVDVIWEKHQLELESLRCSLNAATGESWEEWEIPREADDEWVDDTKELHAQWWERRIARQTEIDAAIARRAPQETLYDQPQVDTGKRRVTGPFSVEAVSAPSVKSIDEVNLPEVMPATILWGGPVRRCANLTGGTSC